MYFQHPSMPYFLCLYTLDATLWGHIVPLEYIFQPDAQNLEEGAHHCEDHPDVDQLDVRRAWKGLTDPKETKKHSKRQIIGTWHIICGILTKWPKRAI